jgi:HK97 gp10 family phage protein
MTKVQRIRGRLAQIAANPEPVRRAVREAMEKVAADIVMQMKRIAPKDSGDLAKSIAWVWGRAPKGAMAVGTVTDNDENVITIYAGGKAAGLDAFYARFQEFGTVDMRANPFFYPTWRHKKRGVKAKLAAAVRRGLKSKT